MRPNFMDEKSQLKDSLRRLAGDAAESAAYLRELGVEGLEGVEGFSSGPPVRGEEAGRAGERTDAAPPSASPALKRHANAERAAPASGRLAPTPPPSTSSPLPPTPKNLPAPPRAATGEAPSVLYQTEMPKKPVRPPSPNPPEPMQTLFGEIAPKDELSLGRPGETFEDIREDIGECVRCPLHEGRTKIVHTEGNTGSRLMFVGEAPGADEDASGRPFVGRAGQLLNKIIEAIGLKREDVLIGNVNRCRPPGNRQPTSEEAKTCKPFLLREIAIARPDVIVVLGNTAMHNLLDTKVGITRVRGQFQDYKGIKVMPTFHPAYLLRDPSKKREVWDDMKKVRDYLNEVKK
jgi:uracil-DNA glycosylase